MKRVRQILSPSSAQAQRFLQWVAALFVLPLALFVGGAMLLGQPRPQVLPVQTAELWQEPLGKIVFDAERLPATVQTAPDFSQAQ